MESPETVPDAPVVFLSYSHESTEHKMWVSRLARDLRKNGVDAILDQWDVRFGDDLAAFMERGIRDSTRVILVCTPEYARKADAGAGGVGYEKMIVTGEMYQNLGSSKFIPLIVRGKNKEALPSFLKSLRYVDFRDESSYDERLVDLLLELHDAPANLKPPLGPKPSVASPQDAEEKALLPDGKTAAPVDLAPVDAISADEVYDTCIKLMRTQDPIGWRQLLKKVRPPTRARLAEWATDAAQAKFQTWEEFSALANEGIARAMPLIAMGLAGVESGLEKFNDQRSLVDDFLSLSAWPTSGVSVLVAFPRSIVYVYHLLHGATAMCTEQREVALRFATMNIRSRGRDESEPVWQQDDLTGWPKSLSGNCVDSWKYVQELPKRFTWLESIFGGKEDYESSLGSYNALLVVLDLAHSLQAPNFVEALEKRSSQMRLDVPPMFLFSDRETVQRSFTKAFRDPVHTALLAANAGVKPDLLREHWPVFLAIAYGQFDTRYALPRLPELSLP